jgi:PAS domain S-box-containing protein
MQMNNLERLRAEALSSAAIIEQSVALQGSGQPQLAKQELVSGAAKARMDQVRTTTGAMQAEQLRLLGLRSSESRRSAEYLLIMVGITHGVIGTLVIFAGLLVRSDVAKRTATSRRLQELSDREHTARQMAEAAHQRTESVLSSIAEMFTLLDKEWNIVYVNEQVTRVTGKPRIALLGKNYWSAFPEAVGTEFEHACRRAMESQQADSFEAFDRALHKWFSVQLYPAAGALTVFAQDISELRQAREGLVRAEKLAAVGRMASTIAHEINNPLEAVTNLLWLARNERSASPAVLHYLAAADEELTRVAQISKHALGFYRDSNLPARVDLREVVESVLSLYARRLSGKHIAVRTEYESSEIDGYPGELRQLFSNLCANSLDALYVGGKLSLKVARAADWSDASRKGARITIGDNGAGIRAEYFANLFQPFFTTKEATGTGLGLWVSKQIVEKHGGTIRLRSSSRPHAHYTAVSVFLPFTQQAREMTGFRAAGEEDLQARRVAS